MVFSHILCATQCTNKKRYLWYSGTRMCVYMPSYRNHSLPNIPWNRVNGIIVDHAINYLLKLMIQLKKVFYKGTQIAQSKSEDVLFLLFF